MAAATVLNGPDIYPGVGPFRVSISQLDSPANTNTHDTGLEQIYGAWITSCDSTALAAADSLSVTAVSGGTITLGVIGTGRDCYVLAIGL